MTLTEEQIKNLKEQLKQQVEHLPEDKKLEAIKQIDSLSSEALEEMLKQQSSTQTPEKQQKPVFRMIVDNDIPSTKIEENKFAIAVLDIMPISKGHTIIIPKKQVSDSKNIPSQAFSLAKKISKKISSKLNPSSINIQTETKFEEAIINIIPSYEKKLDISSQRTKSNPEELENIAKSLRPKESIKKIKLKKTSSENSLLKIDRKIPW
jgi:histidine triad (HIT) family protein